MNMTMNQISGFEFSHKPEKNFETSVAGIIVVVDTRRCGVGEQNIEVSAPENSIDQHFRYQADNSPEHLKLGELVLSVIVTAASSKSGENEVVLFIRQYLSVDTG